MVNVRNAASPGKGPGNPDWTVTKVKRPRESSSPAGPSKRRMGNITEAYNPSPFYAREGSPGKSVHFGRNLIQGPTMSDPTQRSQSPTRPALHKQGFFEDDPSAQLQAEHEAAQVKKTTRKRKLDQRAEIEELIYGTDPPHAGYDHDYDHVPKAKGTKSQSKRKRPDPSECLVRDEGDGSSNTARDQRRRSIGHNHEELSDEFDSILGTEPAAPISDSTVSRSVESVEQEDYEICEKINELRSMAMQFAKSFSGVSAHQKLGVLDQILKPENVHLIKYIGCLAMGGKSGVDGWVELLADTTSRQALVLGIIGRALKENVFSVLYFGGSERLFDILDKKEKEQVNQDGFFRTRERANAILKYKTKPVDVAGFRSAVTRVMLQLEHLLLPLWNLGSKSTATTWRSSHRRRELAQIVSTAGVLSRSMRSSPDVVYYWPPTFKDEEFEPGHMECFNLRTMITESPYDKKTVSGFDRAVLREGHEHESEAIVRVVCFPGLVSYKQHGGALATQELAEEEKRKGNERLPPDVQMQRKRLAKQETSLTGDEGFRTRILCKSVVLLQWGKQRLLTKEAGTSQHLDAMKGNGSGMEKYDDDYDGFVELYDVFEKVTQEGKSTSQVQREADGTRTPSLVSSVTRLFSRSPSATSYPGVNREQSARQVGVGVRPASRGRR